VYFFFFEKNCCAVMDEKLGNDVKSRIVKLYEKDLEPTKESQVDKDNA
jgi:hypothetical protein